MKIVFSICNIGFGHVTRSLRIINELDERGHEVYVMVGSPYDDFMRDRGYRTFTLTKSMDLYEGVGERWKGTLLFSSASTVKFSLSILKARKTIKKVDPDVLVSDSEPSSILSTRNVKKAFLTHQLNLFVGDRMSKFNIVWKKILKICDKVIIPDVVGIDVPKDMKGKSEKVGPLTNVIDQERDKLREKLGMERETILVIPSFSKRERHRKIDAVKDMDYDFIFLGQEKSERVGNVELKRKEEVESPCEYIKASDSVILSGYTSLMESVYYRRPVFVVPTQLEQEKVAELGKKNGILEKGRFTRDEIEKFVKNRELQEKIKKNQSTYHSNGARKAADVIENID